MAMAIAIGNKCVGARRAAPFFVERKNVSVTVPPFYLGASEHLSVSGKLLNSKNQSKIFKKTWQDSAAFKRRRNAIPIWGLLRGKIPLTRSSDSGIEIESSGGYL
jgi:hypothetical protein